MVEDAWCGGEAEGGGETEPGQVKSRDSNLQVTCLSLDEHLDVDAERRPNSGGGGSTFLSSANSCELFSCPLCLVLEYCCKYWLSTQTKRPSPCVRLSCTLPLTYNKNMRLEMDHLNY